VIRRLIKGALAFAGALLCFLAGNALAHMNPSTISIALLGLVLILASTLNWEHV